MVNGHGDRKSPKDGVVGPLPDGLFMTYKGGDPSHLLAGMILPRNLAAGGFMRSRDYV